MAAKSLDEMGACSGPQSLMGQTLESQVPLTKFLNPGHHQCSTKLIQLVLLGEVGVTSFPFVSEERDPEAHPQRLFDSPGQGALLLVLWPNPEGHSGKWIPSEEDHCFH